MSGQRAPKTVGDVAVRLRRLADTTELRFTAKQRRFARELYLLAETLEAAQLNATLDRLAEAAAEDA